jgi:hypothetical protein
MSFENLSGPVIHLGISAALALLFRLNLFVAMFCGILPDLVDKPLSLLGIGGGRYVGHTLLFSVLVVAAFLFWKRKYGLAALLGLTSHLLLDLNSLVPWFYPFKHYNFLSNKLSISEWLKHYLTFSQFGLELIIVALIISVLFLGWWVYRRYKRRKNT